MSPQITHQKIIFLFVKKVMQTVNIISWLVEGQSFYIINGIILLEKGQYYKSVIRIMSFLIFIFVKGQS